MLVQLPRDSVVAVQIYGIISKVASRLEVYNYSHQLVANDDILAKLVEWQLQLLWGQAYDRAGARCWFSHQFKALQTLAYTLSIPQAESLCYETLHNSGSKQHDADCRLDISLFQ